MAGRGQAHEQQRNEPKRPSWRERIAMKQDNNISALAKLIHGLLNEGAAYTNYAVTVEDDGETFRIISFNPDTERRAEIVTGVDRFWKGLLLEEVRLLRIELGGHRRR